MSQSEYELILLSFICENVVLIRENRDDGHIPFVMVGTDILIPKRVSIYSVVTVATAQRVIASCVALIDEFDVSIDSGLKAFITII